MNKEEAIKAIQDFIGWFKTDSRIYKALEMAIQALSQELCEWGKMTFDAISGMSIFEFSDGTVKRVKQAELEPCEDAISRDAVIKIIEDAETARLRGDIDLLYAPILKKLNELTSVNPQPCDDAISREGTLAPYKDLNDDDVVSVWMIKKNINELPPVTQKSGKWILLDECANSGYYCSNCQKKLVKEGWSDTVKKIKFCPNCGADMRGEK